MALKKKQPTMVQSKIASPAKETELQKAFEVLQQNKAEREQAAMAEVKSAFEVISQKYGVMIEFMQPTLKFTAQ